MVFLKSSLLSFCAVIMGVVATPAHAAPANAFTPDQKAALEDYMRNFILDNPEVLMESVNRYKASEDQKKEEDSVKTLKDNMGFINNGKHPEIGNPKGDVLVVEFFDYNCGYCKRAMQAVRKLSENDKNVRVVFMEFPILSPQSKTAAQWAIAANMQGKYWEFHQAVLETAAPKDEDNLSRIAKSVGLDVAKLKKDAASPAVESYLAGVADFGDKLKVTGTPAFIVGNQILRGFMEYEGFKTIVQAERKK